jgi:hypothetical protein
MLLVPALLSRPNAGSSGSINAITLSIIEAGELRSKSAPQLTTAIVATNSKLGNIFLHNLQNVDFVRESG